MDPQDREVKRIDVASLAGPTLGLRGLRGAIDRLRSANVESGMTEVVIAASENIYWVAATDD